MKIKLDGEWVCSVCGAIWKTWHGVKGESRVQCMSCGASPDYVEPGFHYDSEEINPVEQSFEEYLEESFDDLYADNEQS